MELGLLPVLHEWDCVALLLSLGGTLLATPAVTPLLVPSIHFHRFLSPSNQTSAHPSIFSLGDRPVRASFRV